MVHIDNLAPAHIFLNGLKRNESGGVTHNGDTDPFTKKVEVAQCYFILVKK